MIETTAFLKALTPEARESLGANQIEILRFPFRVGRESRSGSAGLFSNSRRRPGSSPHNDLYLADGGQKLNISREHFQIERRNGAFYLVDRGSACGTLVEGIAIGQERNGGETPLANGDVIIVGTSDSRQAFKFVSGFAHSR